MYDAPEAVQQSQSGTRLSGTVGTIRDGGRDAHAVVHDAPFAAFDGNYSGAYEPGDGTASATLKTASVAAVALDSSDRRETRTIVRRLTPLECERLMGWPDNYTAHGITDDGEHVDIANTNRYRICGNGIVATVTEWIGQRLADAVQDNQVSDAA